jgi:hypothetical protein
MTTMAAKLQSPRNNGSVVLGFSLLVVFSQFAERTLSQYNWILSAPGVRIVAVAPLCHLLVNWMPAGGWPAGFCPWAGLSGAMVRLLCGAL